MSGPGEPTPATPPSPPSGWVTPSPPSPPRRNLYLVGFAPLVLFVTLAIIAPRFLAPMFDTSVTTTGGLPLGWLVIGAAGLLMAAGIVLMRAIPSCLGAVLGGFLFTVPSLFLIIIGPAIVLIAQNIEG